MIIVLIAYSLFTIAVAAWLQRSKKHWSAGRRTLVVALPGPIVLLVIGLGFLGYILLQQTRPGGIDTGATAIVMVMVTAGFFAGIALVIGLVVAAVAEAIGRR